METGPQSTWKKHPKTPDSLTFLKTIINQRKYTMKRESVAPSKSKVTRSRKPELTPSLPLPVKFPG